MIDLFDNTDADTENNEVNRTEADRVTSGDYEAHKRRSDAAYAAAFAPWMATLTAAERREVRKLKVNCAALPTISGACEDLGANHTGPVDYDDDGEAIEAPETDDATEDAAPDPEHDAIAELRQQFADGIRKIFGELLHQRNRSLAVECMSLATGILYEGMSEADIARKFVITRAAVSKRCVELCERMGIQPSRAMMQRWGDMMREESDSTIEADLSRVDALNAL